ncbi:MAG: hypothetical protein HYX48_07680 [Chlamydiales bacterium]|nr:hypothetical protein [Chlamydiales bacterium]
MTSTAVSRAAKVRCVAVERTPQTGLGRLPDALVVLFFQYLSPTRDTGCAARACFFWSNKRAGITLLALRRQFESSVPEPFATVVALSDRIKARWPYLKTISRSSMFDNASYGREFMHLIPLLNPKAVSFERNVDESIGELISEDMIVPTTLEFCTFPSKITSKTVTSLTLNLEDTETLGRKECAILRKNFPNLTALAINCIKVKIDVRALLKELPALTALKLHNFNFSQQTGGAFNKFSTLVPSSVAVQHQRLRELSFDDCTVDFGLLSAHLALAPNLERITLGKCSVTGAVAPAAAPAVASMVMNAPKQVHDVSVIIPPAGWQLNTSYSVGKVSRSRSFFSTEEIVRIEGEVTMRRTTGA